MHLLIVSLILTSWLHASQPSEQVPYPLTTQACENAEKSIATQAHQDVGAQLAQDDLRSLMQQEAILRGAETAGVTLALLGGARLALNLFTDHQYLPSWALVCASGALGTWSSYRRWPATESPINPHTHQRIQAILAQAQLPKTGRIELTRTIYRLLGTVRTEQINLDEQTTATITELKSTVKELKQLITVDLKTRTALAASKPAATAQPAPAEHHAQYDAIAAKLELVRDGLLAQATAHAQAAHAALTSPEKHKHSFHLFGHKKDTKDNGAKK